MVQLGTVISGTLLATLTAASTSVTLAAGTGAPGISVPANGTVLGIAGPGIVPGTTLTIVSSTSGTLSIAAYAAETTQSMHVGNFVINSVQPGTSSTLQTADTSTVFWKLDH
jgi:hypothetical protein